jgi:hypothetical protein
MTVACRVALTKLPPIEAVTAAAVDLHPDEHTPPRKAKVKAKAAMAVDAPAPKVEKVTAPSAAEGKRAASAKDSAAAEPSAR